MRGLPRTTVLVNDIKMYSPPDFRRCRGEQGTNRLRGAPVLADNLADIVLRNPQLNHAMVSAITVHLADVNRFRFVYESARNCRNQLCERHGQLKRLSRQRPRGGSSEPWSVWVRAGRPDLASSPRATG